MQRDGHASQPILGNKRKKRDLIEPLLYTHSTTKSSVDVYWVLGGNLTGGDPTCCCHDSVDWSIGLIDGLRDWPCRAARVRRAWPWHLRKSVILQPAGFFLNLTLALPVLRRCVQESSVPRKCSFCRLWIAAIGFKRRHGRHYSRDRKVSW